MFSWTFVAFWSVKGLSDSIVSIVISFSDTVGFFRCSCIAREWNSCVRDRRIEMKQHAAPARARSGQEDILSHLSVLLFISYRV